MLAPTGRSHRNHPYSANHRSSHWIVTIACNNLSRISARDEVQKGKTESVATTDTQPKLRLPTDNRQIGRACLSCGEPQASHPKMTATAQHHSSASARIAFHILPKTEAKPTRGMTSGAPHRGEVFKFRNRPSKPWSALDRSRRLSISQSSNSHAQFRHQMIPETRAPARFAPPEYEHRFQCRTELRLTCRSQTSRFYSTNKSVLRNHRCQGYVTYSSMGFVPLQGTQQLVISVSITDATPPLQQRRAVRALALRPPLAQDNPFSTYFT